MARVIAIVGRTWTRARRDLDVAQNALHVAVVAERDRGVTGRRADRQNLQIAGRAEYFDKRGLRAGCGAATARVGDRNLAVVD